MKEKYLISKDESLLYEKYRWLLRSLSLKLNDPQKSYFLTGLEFKDDKMSSPPETLNRVGKKEIEQLSAEISRMKGRSLDRLSRRLQQLSLSLYSDELTIEELELAFPHLVIDFDENSLTEKESERETTDGLLTQVLDEGPYEVLFGLMRQLNSVLQVNSLSKEGLKSRIREKKSELPFAFWVEVNCEDGILVFRNQSRVLTPSIDSVLLLIHEIYGHVLHFQTIRSMKSLSDEMGHFCLYTEDVLYIETIAELSTHLIVKAFSSKYPSLLREHKKNSHLWSVRYYVFRKIIEEGLTPNQAARLEGDLTNVDPLILRPMYLQVCSNYGLLIQGMNYHIAQKKAEKLSLDDFHILIRDYDSFVL